jgi:DNA-binding NarL/FixJ family response regulator
MTKTKTSCPLTPALLEVVAIALAQGTTSDKELAPLLHRSPSTLKTEWKVILDRLDVHSRFAAIRLSLLQGWVSLPPAAG